MVPFGLMTNIIFKFRVRYCVVHKADIQECRICAAVRYVRFHSWNIWLKDKCASRAVIGTDVESNFHIGEYGMLGRTLTLAAVTLLIGCCMGALEGAQAQNLEAGKSPSQLFASSCAVCHKSPRGLLRTVPPGSLQGFLREHYTTSPDMASVLSSYLISNGAADTRSSGPAGPGPDGRKPSHKRVSKRAKPSADKPDAEAQPSDSAEPKSAASGNAAPH
jgi:hypothetical protein